MRTVAFFASQSLFATSGVMIVTIASEAEPSSKDKLLSFFNVFLQKRMTIINIMRASTKYVN